LWGHHGLGSRACNYESASLGFKFRPGRWKLSYFGVNSTFYRIVYHRAPRHLGR